MESNPNAVAHELAMRKQSAPVKFTKRQQEAIKKKYQNRCAFCCLGVEDGVDICVVHKTALVDGGKATIENGLVLCVEHSATRYDTDTDPASPAKTYVSLMLKVAQHKKDKRMKKFYSQLLKIFKEYEIASSVNNA